MRHVRASENLKIVCIESVKKAAQDRATHIGVEGRELCDRNFVFISTEDEKKAAAELNKPCQWNVHKPRDKQNEKKVFLCGDLRREKNVIHVMIVECY